MNENQKIVLDWLKDSKDYPFGTIADLYQAGGFMPFEVSGAYRKLTHKQEFEVLAAFAEWGLKQDE